MRSTDSHKVLQDKEFAVRQTATYYRLLPANVLHKFGKTRLNCASKTTKTMQ